MASALLAFVSSLSSVHLLWSLLLRTTAVTTLTVATTDVGKYTLFFVFCGLLSLACVSVGVYWGRLWGVFGTVVGIRVLLCLRAALFCAGHLRVGSVHAYLVLSVSAWTFAFLFPSGFLIPSSSFSPLFCPCHYLFHPGFCGSPSPFLVLDIILFSSVFALACFSDRCALRRWFSWPSLPLLVFFFSPWSWILVFFLNLVVASLRLSAVPLKRLSQHCLPGW